VLHVAIAQIVERGVQPVRQGVARFGGDDDLAGTCQRGQASSEIHKPPPSIDDTDFVGLHQSNRLDDIHHHDGAAGTLQLGPYRVMVDGLGHVVRVLT
jgi:hypothetical protein